MLTGEQILAVVERTRAERIHVLLRRLGHPLAARAANAEVEQRLIVQLNVLAFENDDAVVRWLRKAAANVRHEYARRDSVVIVHANGVPGGVVVDANNPHADTHARADAIGHEHLAPGCANEAYGPDARLVEREEVRDRRLRRAAFRAAWRRVCLSDRRIIRRAASRRPGCPPRTPTTRSIILRARRRAVRVMTARGVVPTCCARRQRRTAHPVVGRSRSSRANPCAKRTP